MPDSSFDADIAPSRAERRAAFAAAQAPADAWGEIDFSLLEERRAAVPPFPLDLLPQPWRDWTSDTASSTAAPADYVAQAVLAALAGLGSAENAIGGASPLVLRSHCVERQPPAVAPHVVHVRERAPEGGALVQLR